MKKTLFTIIAIAALISFQQIANAQEVNNDLVRVFRWLNTVDNNFVTLADGEILEGQLLQWK